MQIILKEDIVGLGYKNDIVKVKAGYGRNFLIPQKMAVIANSSNLKMQAENVRQAAHKAEKLKNDALDIANSIAALSINIPAKVGDSGKIFGSVTTTQLADIFKAKGIEVDRKRIVFTSDIKSVGDYEAVIDLHKEVKHKVSFSVIAAE